MQKNFRSDFPYLSEKNPPIYLDSAATTQKPFCVIKAMQNFYEKEYGTVHRAIYALSERATKKYNDIREKVAHFIGAASSESIVFTRGTTESLNLVARCFAQPILKAGDEIVLTVSEHHSNLVPWQMIAKETGAHIRFIPMDDAGTLTWDASFFTERTKIVSIAHIANATGTIHPIRKIISSAHKVGAKVCIDGAQAVAHQPINVQELDADFYAFSAHKMYGPTGVGILYGKQDCLEKMPPLFGGGDMIERVTLEETTYQRPPLRFEAGTPMIAQVIGLGAAINYLEQIGLDKIFSYEKELTDYAEEKLSMIENLRFLGMARKRGSILSFSIEGIHPLDLGTFLNLKNISVRTGHLCAQPALRHFGLDSCTRVSFGIYNTKKEVDHLFDALQASLSLLRTFEPSL